MEELQSRLNEFKAYLTEEEKSEATIKKYMRDVGTFMKYIQEKPLNKDTVLLYKNNLIVDYAPASINSMLTALNIFLRFIGREDCTVRLMRIQRQIFVRKERELNKAEYQRLLKAAKHRRIAYIIQVIGSTGIRVSELQYITVEAVKTGKAIVNCKNKTRVILLPVSAQKKMREYIKKTGVIRGSIFVTKNGKPLDRSNIWKEMKALCTAAHVSPDKVFPHNLRHLFARVFYQIEKDIVHLADLLGHSDINTTRIYTMECKERYLQSLEKVSLLFTT